MDFLPYQVGRARSAIFDLIGACAALPDFYALQIVRFPIISPLPPCTCTFPFCECYPPPTEEWEEKSENMTKGLKKKMKDLEEWAMSCLKESKAGCRERGGARTTLRVIEFGDGDRSVKVEEYNV